MHSPHVAARKLGKSFGSRAVLSDISVEVAPGDIVGVLGKNGAGKTTLLELMLGFTPPSSGVVQLFGYESFRLPAEAKARVGFVPQQDELINQLRARDQLRVIGSFYRNWDESLLQKLSDSWELNLDNRIKGMSVGQRQKLSILTALGHRPDLLILDEPVASLDPLARRQFLEQIVEIAADGNRSVVFSSHIVSDVERLANKIWILKDHRLFWCGEIDALKESVVRVHVRAMRPLPEDLSVPNALHLQREERYATAIVTGWTAESRNSVRVPDDVQFEIQPLTLEEIFLELHR
jgi:ABC-2 type transport system ATP-binding protein